MAGIANYNKRIDQSAERKSKNVYHCHTCHVNEFKFFADPLESLSSCTCYPNLFEQQVSEREEHAKGELLNQYYVEDMKRALSLTSSGSDEEKESTEFLKLTSVHGDREHRYDHYVQTLTRSTQVIYHTQGDFESRNARIPVDRKDMMLIDVDGEAGSLFLSVSALDRAHDKCLAGAPQLSDLYLLKERSNLYRAGHRDTDVSMWWILDTDALLDVVREYRQHAEHVTETPPGRENDQFLGKTFDSLMHSVLFELDRSDISQQVTLRLVALQVGTDHEKGRCVPSYQYFTLLYIQSQVPPFFKHHSLTMFDLDTRWFTPIQEIEDRISLQSEDPRLVKLLLDIGQKSPIHGLLLTRSLTTLYVIYTRFNLRVISKENQIVVHKERLRGYMPLWAQLTPVPDNENIGDGVEKEISGLPSDFETYFSTFDQTDHIPLCHVREFSRVNGGDGAVTVWKLV